MNIVKIYRDNRGDITLASGRYVATYTRAFEYEFIVAQCLESDNPCAYFRKFFAIAICNEAEVERAMAGAVHFANLTRNGVFTV